MNVLGQHSGTFEPTEDARFSACVFVLLPRQVIFWAIYGAFNHVTRLFDGLKPVKDYSLLILKLLASGLKW